MSEEVTTPEDEVVSLENDKSLEMIKKANEAADRMEKANKELDGLLQKQAAIQVQNTLAGQAEVTPPEEKEETPKEYADKVMRGEGRED